ncbi:MAG: phosphoheptose isomerase [Verrucomicrobia bacterium]|nr:MAG: phosphoheptose isomerase [Verrucomicrobiota bacterium]
MGALTKPRVVSLSQVLRSAIADATKSLQSLGGLKGEIAQAANLLVEALTGKKKILACGNGGSAADAADFTTEFACRFIEDRRPYPALNLSQGGSLLTATANDYGFNEIFARQIRAFANAGDVLVAITTSGQSKNIRRALEEAKSSRLKSIALLGRNGGKCRGIADVDLIVASNSTARIQEAHKFLLHVLCEIVEARLPR